MELDGRSTAFNPYGDGNGGNGAMTSRAKTCAYVCVYVYVCTVHKIKTGHITLGMGTCDGINRMRQSGDTSDPPPILTSPSCVKTIHVFY